MSQNEVQVIYSGDSTNLTDIYYNIPVIGDMYTVDNNGKILTIPSSVILGVKIIGGGGAGSFIETILSP